MPKRESNSKQQEGENRANSYDAVLTLSRKRSTNHRRDYGMLGPLKHPL